MENNAWVLPDLPPSCKPLGCKWIFKKKKKVDGTIDKFKAQLVIQGFRQKERIDYFDTYAPVARISTIRLLISLAATHNLVIHQMDVKTAFLNGNLEEEIYMKQPEGFVMPDKCVDCKFDESGKGVIICLYVDDILIFGTDQNQVDKTKEFLSSNFSMKDMGEADVILGIRIKRENKGLTITQSHYITKILKKFNCEGCGPVNTPMEAGIKVLLFMAKAYSQIYNGKYKHLGVRYNMVRELIMNGVISMDFFRSQQNLADHLTKGLARDLVHKSAIRMGLNSI
ncbi:zinc finger, CCHC-type containing protein [Tanacetum coccineum]